MKKAFEIILIIVGIILLCEREGIINEEGK